MSVITEAREIRKCLMEAKPSHIAVAYVGAGWRSYISTDHLKEVVVSPTFGSSPRAIRELMKVLGHENVHFLNELHAKIYIGATSALLGSSNLSDNGLGDRRLREAIVTISDETQLAGLRRSHSEYVQAARTQYPDVKSKEKQLSKLQKLVDVAEWNGIPTSEGGAPNLAEFQGSTNRIHIAWYQRCEPDYNKKAIVAVVPESRGVDPDEFFSEIFLFLEEDRIREGDWILGWHCKDDGLPRTNGAVDWMRVHHVIPSGVKKNDYTKIAGQSAKLKTGTPPFALTHNLKKIIRASLADDRFAKLRDPSKGLWRLADADALVPSFLEFIRMAEPK